MESSIEKATKKAFEEIIEARAFEATTKRAKNDSRYEDIEATLSNQMTVLRGTLNKQQQDLLNAVDDSFNALQAFWKEQAYMQGLKDSPLLSKELKKYGIE